MSTDDSSVAAAATARSETQHWAFIVSLAELLTEGEDIAPTELTITGFDPSDDLARRTRGWFHTLADHSLASLASFAAGLAEAEADAWKRRDPSVATRALSDRRLLLGDRIVHWAVPWLVSLGVADRDSSPEAVAAVDRLLALGDRHRPAPALVGGEGMFPPGCDSIGELPDGIDPTTLSGGWVFARPSTEVGPEPYGAAAQLWTEMASAHAGTEQLWLDMAARATRSVERFGPG